MRIIPSNLHAVTDCFAGGFVAALPLVFYPGAAVSALLVGAGLAIIAYSLLTDFEPSFAKLIPMETHLIFDIVLGGTLMLSAALFLTVLDPYAAWALVAVGAVMVAMALLSEERLIPERKRKPLVLKVTEHQPPRLYQPPKRNDLHGGKKPRPSYTHVVTRQKLQPDEPAPVQRS